MGNYENLKQSITEVIRTNGNQEITGAVLQSTLLTIISSVGANATFAGIATPTTNPGTPDGPVFYLASESGTYTNFNAIELQDGLSVLLWNGSWNSQQIFGVDDEPTAESDNLVKSGGVLNYIGNLTTKNYIPQNYVSPRKYSGAALTQLTSSGGVFTDGSERIEYVKIAMTSTAGANAFSEITISDFNVPAGNYFANILVKSSISTTLRFLVFVSSSSYFETTVSLNANTWTFISVPVVINSTSDRLTYRYDVSDDCDMYIAKPSLTKNKTKLGKIVEWYKENENKELQTLDKGLNLYKGCDIVDHYYNTSGNLNELSGYSVSRPIKVEQGEKYTINHSHIIICYDKNDNAVVSFNPAAAIFNTYTFTVPFGINYIRTNVKSDFYDNFVINKGETATDTPNYELDGILIKHASIHQEQLDPNIVLEIPDSSITLAKLANPLIQYLANGANLQDGTITQAKLSATLLLYLLDGGNIAVGTITQNKLASSLLNYLLDGSHISNGTITLAQLATEVAAYFTNGGNIGNGTITQAKLSAELIQFIQSAGGGTITNNADGVSIVVNTLSQLSVNWEAAGIFFTKNGEDTQGVISRISAYSGKATLVLLNDLTVHNSYTDLPSNLYKVIGAGGKIIPYGEVTSYRYLTFPSGCIFEGGCYQMFDKWVILNSTDGWLEGCALCDWWGCEKDGTTNCQTSIEAFMGSKFKNIRFTKGTYVAYPSNGISNRNIFIDEDVIFDGVFHIAYGNYNTRTFCKNVHVFGKVVSTIRVGGAYIDGLYIPDGIKILANNSNYINQTAEGGCKGVHFNYSNKNFEIGDIEVEQSVPLYHGETLITTYAFGLDAGDSDNREPNHSIHIKSLKCGPNTSAFYDLMLSDGCYDIKIDKFTTDGGDTPQSSIYIGPSCKNITVSDSEVTFNNPSGYPIIAYGESLKFGKVIIESTQGNGNWGLFLNGVTGAFVENIETKNQAQGIRIINCENVVVVNHHSVNDTTPLAQSSSKYKVLNTFVD